MNFECLDTLLHYYQKWDKESFNECRKISIKLGTRKVSLVMNKSTEFQEIIDTHFSGFFQKNYLFV
ncbi:MAG: hypothetical protein Q8K60_05935, partial [Parachlamydiaceae bacterium]|nr:hypothetical protein [Parachlamydiaceae bacterium]